MKLSKDRFQTGWTWIISAVCDLALIQIIWNQSPEQKIYGAVSGFKDGGSLPMLKWNVVTATNMLMILMYGIIGHHVNMRIADA